MNHRWTSLYEFWGIPRAIAVLDSPGRSDGPCIVVHSDQVALGPGPASLIVSDDLCPAWARPPRPYNVFLPPVADMTASGDPLAWIELNGQHLPAIVKQGETVNFAFDLEEAVLGYLFEKHISSKQSLLSRLPFNYHIIPNSIRSWIGHLLTNILFRDKPTPEDCVEPSVELLRGLFLRIIADAGGVSPDHKALWPEGKKYAVALSHDVDTTVGLQKKLLRLRPNTSCAPPSTSWLKVILWIPAFSMS
jgi:hypothetical protein